MTSDISGALSAAGELLSICMYDDEPGSCDMAVLEGLKDEIKKTTGSGSGALHFVALGKNMELANWLIKNNASFHCNDNGETPFHWACKAGYEPMVTLFWNTMPKRIRSLRDKRNKTAKTWAKDFDQPHIVSLLSQERTKQLANSRKSIAEFFSRLTGSQANIQ